MNNSITMEDYLGLINENLDDVKYVVEVGSMDGNDSMFFKNKYPNAEVFAIEGLPDNYEKYLVNKNKINTFCIVISDYCGTTDYYVKDINGIHGIFDRGTSYGSGKIELECKTLDVFCGENNIPQIDVLKIDVEGATLNVLMGMINILPNVKMMHIETEDYPFFKGQTLHEDVEKFLIGNDFRLLEITKAEITKNCFQYDSVWINNKT